MQSLTRRRIGFALIILATTSVVLSLAGSTLTAPSVTETDHRRDGHTLVSGQQDGTITMFDETGDVVWTATTADQSYDATLLEDGTVLVAVTYRNNESCGQFEAPCARTGFQIIDPAPEPHVVREWTYPVRTVGNSQVHDVDRLPSGEILVADMEYESLFTVAPNDTITWQWNASERYGEPTDPTTTDWLHLNDVDPLGAGRFLVSVRNANELLIVERGEGVVEVIEGVKEGREDRVLFVRQHNPQYLGTDTLLVADSEHDRAVEIHRENGEWTLAWTVGSAGGLSFDWPRDADRLDNGNTLIADSRRNRVVEVAENGSTVWSVQVPGLVYEADRLPESERVGAQRYGNGSSGETESPGSNRDRLPVFGSVHAGLTHVVHVPYWFRPWHVAVIAAAIPTAVIGLALVWTGRSLD
ncbi:arylsulfotransferase family protein [Natribaculum luteum]|uniref:Arylsulfotransferase family protein n=1 Tax=Natribaculum luteum TaxID=1586232 RepID=A0ABD5NUF9_9EURY|nr:arylsulfotransferase family protein [Natribaculum luteum]